MWHFFAAYRLIQLEDVLQLVSRVDALIDLLHFNVIVTDELIHRILVDPAIDLLEHLHFNDAVGADDGHMHDYAQCVHWREHQCMNYCFFMGQLNKVLLCIFLLLLHLLGRQKIHQFQATFAHRLDI